MYLKERESLLLGFGDVRCALYDEYKAQQTVALSDDFSIGKKTAISVGINKDNKRVTYTGDAAPSRILTTIVGAVVQASFIEISLFNLLTMLNLDNSSTSGSIFLDDSLDQLLDDKYLRVECIFTYPLKDEKMAIILPKTKMVSNIGLANEEQDASNAAMEFETVKNDVTWGGTKRLGRIYFFTE